MADRGARRDGVAPDARPFALGEAVADLPDWVGAVEGRLRWLARRRRGRRAAQRRLARAVAALSQDGAASLARFQHGCLRTLEEAMRARATLRAARGELGLRLGLARAVLGGDEEARRALERREDATDLDGAAFWAGRVPGRVVWLAAMVAAVPGQVAPAAVMLVNDVAMLGRDAPLRALEAAAGY